MQAELSAARDFDKRAIAKLITAIEDSRTAARSRRREISIALADLPEAPVVGITGAPGVGKSTLVSVLCERLLLAEPRLRIGVVAVDPTSSISGGSVLGDRTRLQLSGGLHDRLYFRSQPSSMAVGGLSPATYQVVRALQAWCGLVVVESVGVGQSEVDVCHLADLSVLLVGPNAGDDIQLMKAGIIEMPDLFVAAKADLADQATAVRLARAVSRPVIEVSARTGRGMDELQAAVLATEGPGRADSQRRSDYFFQRWVVATYGAVGLQAARAGISGTGLFEDRQAAFERGFLAWLQNR